MKKAQFYFLLSLTIAHLLAKFVYAQPLLPAQHVIHQCSYPITEIPYKHYGHSTGGLLTDPVFGNNFNSSDRPFNVSCPHGSHFAAMDSANNWAYIFKQRYATLNCNRTSSIYAFHARENIDGDYDSVVDAIDCLVPYIDLFDQPDGAMKSFDCSPIYSTHARDTDPPFILIRLCTAGTVWSEVLAACISIAEIGCRKYRFQIVSTPFYIARTMLHCQSDCTPPTIGGYPFSDHRREIYQAKLSPTVNWRDCESIYVSCPIGSDRLSTFNSFLNTYRVYSRNAATIYCGRHRNYYVLYENRFGLPSKMCSNSFDFIDCVAASNVSNNSQNNPYAIDASVCFDDLIKKKSIQLRLIEAYQTKILFIVLILLSTILFSLTTIVHMKFTAIQRLLQPYLPKTRFNKFLRHYSAIRIRNAVSFDDTLAIGNGIWANVYRGTVLIPSTTGKSELTKIAVKVPTIHDDLNWINQIKIQTSFDSHENILKLIGFCLMNHRRMHCIIMELADMNLLQRLQSEEIINSETFTFEFLKISKQIIEAMMYLIQNEVIHRNLQAANVLLDMNGCVKLSGFGFAIFFVNNSCINYSDKNDKLLPIRWMSIESISEHRFSEQSDVWSFGILLYEMLTFGERPYANIDNDNAVIAFVDSGKRLAKPEMADDEMFQLMMECWSRFPYYRPTFVEMHRKFCRFAERKIAID